MVKSVKHRGLGEVEVVDGPIPTPEAGQILIKVGAAAHNPVDNHINSKAPVVGATIGHDFAGIVEEVGPGVTKFQKGDRVAGLTFGSCSVNHTWGAFAEYAIGFEQVTLKVPEGVSLEDAATLPVAISVAGLAFDQILNLKKDEPIFIHSGASACGAVLIQFAKSIGAYPIITTASPHNFDYVKSFGATHVFDYNDETFPQKIVEVAGGKLTKAVDTYAVGDRLELFEAIMSTSGGTVAVLQRPLYAANANRKEIKYEMVWGFGPFDLEYEMFGHRLPRIEGAKDLMYKWSHDTAQKVWDQGGLKPLRVKRIEGGLNGVREGMKLYTEGKVSGVKLTYLIDESL